VRTAWPSPAHVIAVTEDAARMHQMSFAHARRVAAFE
jgi:hypothetical protein